MPLIYTQGKEEGIANKLSHHLPRGFAADYMFKVIKFAENLTVEVVCYNWEVVGDCAYPPYRSSRMLSALRTSETVLPECPEYQVGLMGVDGKFIMTIFR